MKVEFYKPYELKVAWVESARERFERQRAARVTAGAARVQPSNPAAFINAKKALKLDLVAALLAKYEGKKGCGDEIVECVRVILAI